MRYYKLKYVFIILITILIFSSGAFGKKKKDINTRINEAIPLYLKKKYKPAMKIFLEILKEDSKNIVARYYIAEILFTDVRRYNDAAKQFEIVLKLKDKVASDKFQIRNKYIFNNSLLRLGLVYLKNGQNYKAIEYLKEYLRNDKESPARVIAYNSLAVAYSNLDDYESSIDYLQEAIKIDKENLLARFNLSVINSKLIYYNTGIDLSIQGKHIEAAREFVKALDVDPFFVAAHFRLGIEHKYLRNYTDAQNELQRALAINPDYVYNYRIYTELADISVDLRDFDQAREYLDKSFAINENYAYYYNVRGKIFMKEGDYKKAEENFKKAKEIRFDPEFEKNIENAKEALGKPTEK